MIKVNNELSLYDAALVQKPQIVAVNKIDLPDVREKMERVRADFISIRVKVQFVSAATGEGVRELMRAAYELLKKVPVSQEAAEPKVFRPQPKQRGTEVSKEGYVFVIDAPDIERIIMRINMDDPTVRWQVHGLLMRRGIVKELEKAGIKGGDKVRCGNAEWEW
jgi:GTP-binding protein